MAPLKLTALDIPALEAPVPCCLLLLPNIEFPFNLRLVNKISILESVGHCLGLFEAK